MDCGQRSVHPYRGRSGVTVKSWRQRLRKARPLGAALWLAGSLLAVSCAHLPADLLYHVDVAPQPILLQQDAYYFDLEDSTTVFECEGFRVKVRYQTDAELNQELASDTFREPNLNPFTYGADRDLDRGYAPPRFTVFQVTVVNQAYPKVMIDPARVVLHTDRGARCTYWDVRQRDAANSFEGYYMERRGQGGNEDYYFQQRLGLVRATLYRRNTFVYQGESYTGKVVFAPLHPDVREMALTIPGVVLRVDAFDRPTRTVDAEFRLNVEQRVAERVVERE